MATVREHYDEVRSYFDSWMSGEFDNAVQRNADSFEEHGLSPSGARSGSVPSRRV